MNKIILLLILVACLGPVAKAQWPLLDDDLYLNPSDPARPYSKLGLSGDLFDMVDGNLWQYKFFGSLAIDRYKHQLEIEIPMVRSEYPGIENLSGIGDLKAGYMYVFYKRKLVTKALTHAAASFKVSFPTGDVYSGHGIGKMAYIPAIFLAFKPVDEVSIYPSVRYIFSEKSADGEYAGGFPGTIPGSDGSSDQRISVLYTDAAFNIEFNQAWIGAAPIYSYEFNENDFTINLRLEVAKLFGDSFLLKLNSTFYVAGERRLISWTFFEASWYLY